MPGKIDEMRDAGFSDQEISAYATEKRQEMSAAGFPENEIDGYFQGTTVPQQAPPSFTSRLAAGASRIFSSAAEGAERGFGSQPLGLSVEDEQKLSQLGVFRDPSTGRGGPIRFMNEAMIRPAAAAVDAITRGFSAGVGGVAGAVSQAASETGLTTALSPGLAPDTAKSKLESDLNVMGQLGLLLGTAEAPHASTLTRPDVDAVGNVHDAPIGGVPKAEDFNIAAKSVASTEANEPIEQKLLTLYTDHGFHPAEVAHDADRDATVAQSVLSDGGDLPYGIDNRIAARAPELDAALTEAGVDPRNVNGPVRDRVLSIMDQDPEAHPLDAYQRAVGELSNEEAVSQGREPVIQMGQPGAAPASSEPTGGAERSAESGVPQSGAGGAGDEEPAGPGAAGRAPATASDSGGGGAQGGNGGGLIPPFEPPGIPRPHPEGEPPFLIEGPVSDAQKKILDRLSVGEEDSTRGMTLGRLYTHIVDKLFPISEAVKEAAPEGLPTSENPYQLGRLLSGVAGKAEHMLKYGTFDFNTYENNGPSLQDILAPVKNDLDGLRAFAVAARAAELENRGIDTGVDMDAARQVVEQGKRKYGPVMLDLVKYQNNLAAYLRDSGVLSKEGHDAMLEANKLYVPFNRVMGDGIAGGPKFGKATLQARNPIRRIEGSERIIVDPLENIIRNTYLFTSMAEKNAVGVKLIDMLLNVDKALEGKVESPLGEAPIEGEFTEANEPKVEGPKNRLAPPMTQLVPSEIRPQELDAARDFLKAEGIESPPDDLLEAMQSEAHGDTPGTISIYRNGKRETYEVDPDLARAFKGLDAESVNWAIKLLSIPTNILRAGAVLTPDFALRHMLRDYVYAAVTNKERSAFTPVDMAKGIYGLVVHDKDFQDWLKGGGSNISMVSMDRRYLQQNLEKLTAQTGIMTRAWNVVGNPEEPFFQKLKAVGNVPLEAVGRYVLNPLRMLTELAESASHLGAFKKARTRSNDVRNLLLAPPETREALPGLGERLPVESGEGAQLSTELQPGQTPTPSSATTSGNKADIQSAAWKSRDIAVDAARSGASMRAYNMITAFANITVQDTDRIARAFKDDPAGTALKVGLGITLPSAILWAVNHQDPRYNEIPEWERDTFWIVMTPDHIFRIPKPFGAGVLFGSGMERILSAVFTKNPDAMNHFIKSLNDTMKPNFFPTVAAPIIDQFANRSTFTNRTLIPAQMEKLLPEYQYTPYTSETAKALGRIIGAFPGISSAKVDQSDPVAGGVSRALSSPILLENYLRGWTGNLGMYALSLVDASLRKTGTLPDPPQPTSTLSDIPVIKAFTVRYPTATTQSIQDFEDEYYKNKAYLDSWKFEAANGDQDAMRRIQAAGGPRMFAQLDSIVKTIGEHSKMIRDIYKDPQMQPDEKRQLIDTLYYNEIQLGQAGKAAFQQIDRGLSGQTLQ